MNTSSTSILEALARAHTAHSLGCPACGKRIAEVQDGRCSLCTTKLQLQVSIPWSLRLRVLLMGFPMAYSFLSALILAIPMAFSTSLPREAVVAEICGFLSGIGLFTFWCLRHRFIRARAGIQLAWLTGIWLGYCVLAFIVFVAM